MDDMDSNSLLGYGMAGAGAGGMAAAGLAHATDRLMAKPGIDFRGLDESISELGNLSKGPQEQFLAGYVRHGGRLARTPIEYDSKALGRRVTGSVGDYMLEVENRGADLITNGGKFDGKLAKAMRFLLPKSKFDAMKEFVEARAANIYNPYEGKAALEHYNAFAEGEGAAYKQLMNELPQGNFVHMVGGKAAPASAERGVLGAWANALAKKDSEINDYISNFKEFGVQRKHGTDFVPFFREMRETLGIEPGMTPQQIQDKLQSSVFNGEGIHTFAGHADSKLFQHIAQRDKLVHGGESVFDLLERDKSGELLKSLQEKVKKMGIDEVQSVTNDPLSRFSKLLMRARMKSAPGSYGLFADAIRKIKMLKSTPALAASGVLSGAGLYSLYNNGGDNMFKMASSGLSDDTKTAIEMAGAIPGYMGIANATGLVHDKGWRKLNPFGDVKGVVLGGNITPDNTSRGSFSNQTKALVEAINGGDGISATKAPAFFEPNSIKMQGPDGRTFKAPDGAWTPEDISALTSRKNMKDIDFVAQVGMHPGERSIASAMHNGDIERYRLLSDFVDGNFRQPTEWLGGRNWMKVHDDPKDYTRFLVPGGDIKERGRKANVVTPSIAVADIFKNTTFNSNPSNPLGVMSIGGGAGNFIPFTDVAEADGMKYKMGPDGNPVRNVVDDFVEVFRKKHGGKGAVHIHMGNTPDFNTPAGRMIMRMKEIADAENAALEAGKPLANSRFGGVKVHFDGLMPQKDMVNQFANATDLLIMPGSTSAEVAAMKGDKLPSIVSLLPDTSKPWMPDHWKGNADLLSSVVGSKSVNVNDPNRLRAMEEAFASPSVRQKAPILFGGDAINKAIKRDVRMKRLGNLAKFVGHSTAGAAGAGLAGMGLYDAFRKSFGAKPSYVHDALDNLDLSRIFNV